MRRVLLSLLLIATLGAVVAPFLLRAGSGSGVSVTTDWNERLAACGPRDATLTVMQMEPYQDCVLATMIEAIDAGQLERLQDGMSRRIKENPNFYSACHTPGHKAGQHAYEVRADISALILENRNSTCQYAIGHGVLDGFAYTKPSDDQFRAAAAACSRMDKYPEAFSLCSDGLGHAAWSSTYDLAAAAARCEMLTYPMSRSLCAEGVIMQIYEPANDKPSARVEDAPNEMPARCSTWPGSKDTRVGCYTGAAYAYSRAQWRLYYNTENPAGERLSPGDRERMKSLILASVAACRAHPEADGVSSCLQSLTTQTPPNVYLDEALTEEVCSQYGEWRDRCRDFRFKVQ